MDRNAKTGRMIKVNGPTNNKLFPNKAVDVKPVQKKNIKPKYIIIDDKKQYENLISPPPFEFQEKPQKNVKKLVEQSENLMLPPPIEFQDKPVRTKKFKLSKATPTYIRSH